ncbi:MAG: tetratricopeptide repeat protein [Kofleriaceae bacterium]|nr:tetratricopeptide repeat protein [Kofleriaceae bacterium]MBP6838538.1 tetratricopeptide repeat protein [Kofleriaceae bacterium]
MRVFPAVVPVVVAIALAVTAGAARADLASGRDKLIGGDYKAAIAELTAVSGKDRPAARLLLARAQLETGELAAALATAQEVARSKDPAINAQGRVMAARAARTLGQGATMRADLEALAKARPDDRRARHQLIAVLLEAGAKAEAAALVARTIDEFDARAIDLDDAHQVYFLAEAARVTAQFQLANDSYREATKLDPGLTEAAIAWADLFLQKYSPELAEQTIEEILKVNPNHPDAHAAMAAVQIEGKYDLEAIRFHLERAFAINPRHQRALLVRASVEIDRNQWEAAHKSLDAIAAVNPAHLEALATRATIYWLRDDLARYEAEKKKAFAINPAFADFYRVVARAAVREHRYKEAIDLEAEAIKLRPDHFEAMSGVGLGYLRLGKEKEGLEWLEKSFKGDEYNVRTFNTLELFEKTIPREYTFTTTKSFRIRYHKDEQKLLARYLEPTLERAFADMVRRYGFTPKTPVVLELYADAQDYAIRTVGLPSLGALGVCFGQVITAMSPSNGDINWGMVLWHELAHVFAIQLSNSRVPRWFTEGLSEYETLVARPEWRRENDADLYGAVVEGTLPSVVELNYRFMSGDNSQVVVAYYLSAVTLEYIVATYGFPKVVEALKLFGQGKETPEVVPAITGRTIAQFDADFRAYLQVRLAPYKGTYRLPTGTDDLVTLEKAIDAKPSDPARHARLALGHYAAGDVEQAQAAAQKALGLDRKQPLARYLLAEIALRSGDARAAKAQFQALVGSGIDSFDVRVRLATIAGSEGADAEVEQQLCAAKKLDPERSYPYGELAELYGKQGKQREALAELEHYAMIEQMQLAPLKKLVLGYGKLGQWGKVRTFGEMATFINPGDWEILSDLGRGYLETGDPARSLFTYDSALLLTPAPRRPALVHLGRARALVALGKKAEARAAIAAALKTEPENAEALALRAKL